MAERTVQQAAWLESYPNEDAGVSLERIERHVEEWLSSDRLQKSRDYLKETYSDTNQLRLAAVEERGGVVGFIHTSRQLRSSGEEFIEIEALYTDPSTYGTGLGYQLMESALEWAKSSGLHDIELEVVSYNDRAIRFYQKHSFEKIDGSESEYEEMMPTIRMKQRIRSEDEV